MPVTLRTLISAAALCITTFVRGEVIDTYNFNSPVNDGNPSTGTFYSTYLFSSEGWGQNITGTIVNGAGSSDPNVSDNSAFGMTGFSTSPLGVNKSEGFGFAVNFSGFRDIQLSLDVKFTEGSVDRLQVQYEGAGGLWYDFKPVGSQAPGWLNDIQLDFSGIPGADNNPGFEVRFVRLYASEQGFQAPGGGAYTGGMVAFDNVVWSGTVPVPEPNSGMLLVAGLVTAGGLRALRKRRR